MTRSFRFKYEKRQGQRNQKQARKIDGQKIHGVKCENQANSPNDSRSDHSRVRKLRVESQDTENQQHEENIRLHNPRKKSLPRRKFEGRARGILQRELCLGTVESRNCTAVQLPHEIIGRTHDQIDHFPVQCFLFGEGAAFRDGLLRQRRVASASLRETPQKRCGIGVDLLSKGIINLHGQKTTNGHDRRSRTRMCSGRHRGDVRRKKNVKARGRSSSTSRRNVHGHRHRRHENVLDYVFHRNTQPAGGVHRDQNKRHMTPRSVGKTFINVGGQDGIDYALEPQFKNEWAGRVLVRRDRRHQEENRPGTQYAEKAGDENKFGSLGIIGALPHTGPLAHGAPPPGFFSLGLEFCKCSSSCLASA